MPPEENNVDLRETKTRRKYNQITRYSFKDWGNDDEIVASKDEKKDETTKTNVIDK